MGKFKIFYSWQSDLPGNKTRNLIRRCIDEAIALAEESEAIEAERDEATTGVTGSPNIVTTLFDKIDDCDLFVADISLCFVGTQNDKKKSPNPNVMLELGYAAKKLGWNRIMCLCNVDYGREYPFDIAQNRITNYSFEGKTAKEVEGDLTKIIFTNIRDIRKLKPIAKAGTATHIIGSYDFSDHSVFEGLIPVDIASREGYILHNQELIQVAQQLVAEIQTIAIDHITAGDSSSIEPALQVQSPASSSLQALIEKISGSEVPVQWKEEDLDKATIKQWLGLDVPDTFFDLGGLKRTLPGFALSEPSLNGTDEEKEKYNKLRDLEYKITQLQVRTDYLKTFEGMCFIPLAIQNISAVQDEHIRVVVNVNTGEIIEPDAQLIWSEFDGIQGLLCRDDDDNNDVGVICELFVLPENGVIHTENIPYDPERAKVRMPMPTANGLAYPAKNEKDYALELQEFIAKTDGQGYYEFDVDALRPGECKWLCCGMLLKPIDGRISIAYRIHSSHSAGDLTGTLEWCAN